MYVLYAIHNTQYAIRASFRNTPYAIRIITYEFISPFLTNKANFQESQMNVTKLLTTNYEQ